MKGIIITAALLISLGCAAVAAEAPKVTLDAQSMPMEELAAELTSQTGLQVVCDTDVKANVSAKLGAIELEKVLDAVTKPAELKWEKYFLPSTDEKPTLDKIKAQARAVAAITAGTIIVCDPVTGKQKVFVEQKADAPTVDPDKLGLKAVYLITKPKAETVASAQDLKASSQAVERFNQIQNERMQLMAQMSPEQRVWAMQQEMTSMLSLDNNTRQQMMLDRMRAMREMDDATRDQLRGSMHDTWRSMREQGLVQDGDFHRGDRDGRSGRGGRDN